MRPLCQSQLGPNLFTRAVIAPVSLGLDSRRRSENILVTPHVVQLDSGDENHIPNGDAN